jgi:hypothetical protein
MHRWLIDIGPHCLEVETDTVPDFDSQFTARCLNTGETLTIYGWLIDSHEPLADEPGPTPTSEFEPDWNGPGIAR